MRAHVFLPLVLLTACGAKGAKMPPASEFPPAGQPALTRVVQAGTGGRVLRFTPTVDTADPMSAEIALKTNVKAGDRRAEGEATSYLLVVNRVDSVDADGGLALRTTIEGANVEFKKAFEFTNLGLSPNEQLRGLSIVTRADGRGRLASVSVESDDVAASGISEIGYDPNLLNGLAALPEEAVGVGAEWDALGHLDASGIKIPFVAHYKLLELDGSRVRLDVVLRASASGGEGVLLDADGVKLEEFELEGSGTLKLDLERPTRSEMNLAVKTDVDMEMAGTSFTAKMEFRAKVGPRPM